VPLSGGKDSTYILHLAVNIYNLKAIAMTYDNGFMSELSLDNINNAVAITKVDHIFLKPIENCRRRYIE
jgi:tRNA(Ile)-lysidine synthase TilS/MesJ